MLGFGGEWCNDEGNNLKYIDGFQKLFSANRKINYEGFKEGVCFRLGINQCFNEIKIYMPSPTEFSDSPYLLKDDYDIRMMMQLCKSRKKSPFFLEVVLQQHSQPSQQTHQETHQEIHQGQETHQEIHQGIQQNPSTEVHSMDNIYTQPESVPEHIPESIPESVPESVPESSRINTDGIENDISWNPFS